MANVVDCEIDRVAVAADLIGLVILQQQLTFYQLHNFIRALSRKNVHLTHFRWLKGVHSFLRRRR